MDDVTRATGGARIVNCEHPSRSRTLQWQGDHYLACCAKCNRRIDGPLRCARCGADKLELRRRGGGQRIRSYNGTYLCTRCRDAEREDDDRRTAAFHESLRAADRARSEALRMQGPRPARADVHPDPDDAGDRGGGSDSPARRA